MNARPLDIGLREAGPARRLKTYNAATSWSYSLKVGSLCTCWLFVHSKKSTHALAQLSADLQPMVTRVAQELTPDDRMAMPSSVESLLAVDDLQYVEAGDGTKQFIDSRAAAHPLN